MGAAGAGSSTLGKAVATANHWPHFDSDEYYWLPTDPPFTEKRPPELRVKLLENDLMQHQNWVVSGSLCNWGNFIVPLLTHVIFVYADWPTRLGRIKQREHVLHGPRIMPGGDMYEHYEAFIDWASKYDTEEPISRTKKQHLDWLTTLSCKVIKLDSKVSLESLIQQATKELGI